MHFKSYDENRKLADRLEKIIENDIVSHAYIFEGPGYIDKKSFVCSFMKGILCPVNDGGNCGKCGICSKIDHANHEDVIYIEADGSSIKDEAIVRMQEMLRSKPFGDRHIAVITDSDTMTVRAQNRLLKTLEEPPGKTVIILLSENMENLIPTIQSRCVKYRLSDTGRKDESAMLETAEKIAEMLLRREPFYKLKEELKNILKDKEETAVLLDGLQITFRNMLVQKSGGISMYKDSDLIRNIHAVETARRQIKENVSPAYAIKNLLIKIGG